ncbi:hypothetical protein BH09ACT10_BH09ACT10_17530 [soil metagenome]
MLGIVTRSKYSLLKWFLLCAGVCVVLRLPFIRVPLGIDEGGDAFVAKAWETTQGSMYGSSWLDRSPLLVLIYKLGVLGGDLGVRLLGVGAAILLVIATMDIAFQVSGARAARITGLITAVMTSSVILGAVFTNNELLATVPVAFSIGAVVRARTSAHARWWLFAAGILASCALLIKQSFIDGLTACAVFLLVSWVVRARSGFRWSWVGSWVGGVLVPMGVTLAWFELYSVGVKPFFYAIAGFRIDALSLQHQAQQSAGYMLMHLGLPIVIASGCLLLVPWAGSWLLRRRADPQVAYTLAAWLVAGFIGIVGGGNFYPHYFIQPLAALAVLSGCALALSRRRLLVIVTGALIFVLAVGNVAVGTTLAHVDPPQQRTLAVSDYLRANSHPDDTLYVMYARANLLYYAGMPTPYKYSWSMMVRTVPDAEQELRTLLKSPTERPTWIVEWQEPTLFGMDASGETRQLIASHYTAAARVCDKLIMIRKDQASRPLHGVPEGKCASLDLPLNLGPSVERNPRDSAEYLWQ